MPRPLAIGSLTPGPLAQVLPPGWPSLPADFALVPRPEAGSLASGALPPQARLLVEEFLVATAPRLGRAASSELEVAAVRMLEWVLAHHMEELSAFDRFGRACLRRVLDSFEEEVGRRAFMDAQRRRRSKAVPPSAERLRERGRHALMVERVDQEQRDRAAEAYGRRGMLLGRADADARRQVRACDAAIEAYLDRWRDEFTRRLRGGSRFLRTPGVRDEEVCDTAVMALYESLAEPEKFAHYARAGVELSLRIALRARDRLRMGRSLVLVALDPDDGTLDRLEPTPTPEDLLSKAKAEQNLTEVVKDVPSKLTRIQAKWWDALVQDVGEGPWENRINGASIADRMGCHRSQAKRMAETLREAVVAAGGLEALRSLLECNN